MTQKERNRNNSEQEPGIQPDKQETKDQQEQSSNKRQTGGSPSVPQRPTHGDVERNGGVGPEEETRPTRNEEKSFDLLVDSVPYIVHAVPYSFNGEQRYRVRFNGSPEHVFTWDSSVSQLRAINDDASTMPDNLEIAIAERLQGKG